MQKGKTKSGFNYTITDDALNNYELFEVIEKVEEKPLLMPKLVDMLLGEKQKKGLMDHLRNEKGVVPI